MTCLRPGPGIEVPPEVVALVDAMAAGFTWADRDKRQGGCIRAARTGTAVLAGLGIAARPLAADLLAGNAALCGTLHGGRDSHGRPVPATSRQTPAGHEIHWEPGSARHGHVVIVGADWFVDLTVGQAADPPRGIHIDGPMVGPYVAATGTYAQPLVGGGFVRWWWRPEIARFRRTPAWREDVPPAVVDNLLARMSRAVW